ncbi:MAG: LpxL/LpxP family acyltransferase, partial [Planctomycetota bacterium]
SGWQTVAERGSVLGLRITAGFYKLFGRTLTLIVFVVPLSTYFWATGRQARNASRQYLDRLRETPGGKGALPRSPNWRSTFRHIFEFATTILDRFCFFTGNTKGFEVVFERRDHILKHLDRGQGVLLVGSHLGCLDVMRVLASERRMPVNVVMYTQHAERINGLLRRLNPNLDMRAIQLQPGQIGPVFDIRDRLARGELVAILGDRVAAHDRARVTRVPFLGHPADFPQGAWILAHLLECPVVLLHGLRTGSRRYEVIAEPIADRVELPRKTREEALQVLITRYAKHLETYCRKAPYQWFNFYDFWA